MRAMLRKIKQFLGYPTGWFLFAIAFAWTAWIGYQQPWGFFVAGGMGTLIYTYASLWSMTRCKLARLRTETQDSFKDYFRDRITLNTASAILWRSDGSGNRFYMSKTWTHVTGKPVKEGLDMNWTDCVHSEDRERCIGAFRICSMNREPADIEYRLQGSDGNYFSVMDRVALCLDDEGRFIGFVGVTIDLTDRKRAEADRLQQFEELLDASEQFNRQATELAERFREVEATMEILDHDNRVKTEYLAALADELREPIEEMGNVSDLLRSTEANEQQQSFIARIGSASGDLSGLLVRAVELSELMDEGVSTENSVGDLRELVEGVAENLKQTSGKPELEIHCTIDKDIPELIKTDPARFRRVLTELWSVAIRFAEDDIEIVAEILERKDETYPLRLSIALPCDRITQEDIERAFYPRESVGGEAAGLGLGPCKLLAQQLAGTVAVERNEAGETVFRLDLSVDEVLAEDDPRRIKGRLAQENVKSNYGPVVDLSMGAVCIRSTKMLEGILDLELTDDEETLEVRAEVAWSRRVGFRRHEIGMNFLDLQPETATQLSHFAARNRPRRTMEAA